MPKILVVDDDPNIRELVSILLRREGFQIIEAQDGQDALERLETVLPDLAVIDVMMPRMDGWTLCETLRASYDMPLLLLTAKGETANKVKGFGLGADDYMVKPFEPLELAVRIKALLKRYRIAASQTVELGQLTLNLNEFHVTMAGKRMLLPPKEFELLFKLASYPDKTFSREQLIEQIWGMNYEGDERTVDVHIKRLRERFTEEEAGIRIVTIRGLGYRMEELE
ncbi:DNA-binding response regulator, OmpR family, contains REC and winged-helix (wHTH) domain [Paenibacillus algorifonticola]|uniref:Heme response regulator HssR n=1 Tax=Paenibacillus algorifonticola TaxID=684063 RepID=A0A1I2FAC6_9BACL|nr:response regulator transcription factor [Paenibacillus algorifonticola]SFF01481.1 DNA-binding response regulator, OmpR family, contains REC and winged-helix (wHTH) domain [Paenibacillus algorifonticola]